MSTTDIYTYCHTLSIPDALPIFGRPIRPAPKPAHSRAKGPRPKWRASACDCPTFSRNLPLLPWRGGDADDRPEAPPHYLSSPLKITIQSCIEIGPWRKMGSPVNRRLAAPANRAAIASRSTRLTLHHISIHFFYDQKNF